MFKGWTRAPRWAWDLTDDQYAEYTRKILEAIKPFVDAGCLVDRRKCGIGAMQINKLIKTLDEKYANIKEKNIWDMHCAS